MNFFLVILLILTIAISLSQLGVILFFINFIKKNDLNEGAIKDVQEKSASVIINAVSKANDVVAKAEEAELKKVSEQSSILDSLTKTFEKKAQSFEESAEQNLSQSASQAQDSYSQFVTDSQQTLNKLVSDDRKVLEEKTNQMITQSSAVFEQFMTKLSGEVRTQLAGEMAKAKQEVDVYKKERMETINEKVIDILEEVLLATLGKKLSLKDEGEFVFQALETAKKEHAFDA
jgi:hypothetical protein